MRPVIEITIGGRKRPLRFGFNAIAEFCDEAGLSLSDLSGLDERRVKVSTVRALFYAGLKDGARKEKREVDFDLFDVGDWMEDLSDAEAAKVWKHFAEAQGAEGNAPAAAGRTG